jgi:hypothetical protein
MRQAEELAGAIKRILAADEGELAERLAEYLAFFEREGLEPGSRVEILGEAICGVPLRELLGGEVGG